MLSNIGGSKLLYIVYIDVLLTNQYHAFKKLADVYFILPISENGLAQTRHCGSKILYLCGLCFRNRQANFKEVEFGVSVSSWSLESSRDSFLRLLLEVEEVEYWPEAMSYSMLIVKIR